METSNVVSTVPMTSLLAPSPTESGGSADCDSLLMLFDDIWMKLIQLAKRLRDIMRTYNEIKQRLGWDLQVNALETQMKTIDETYKASLLTGIGSLFSGVLTLGLGAKGGEAGLMLGQNLGHGIGGAFSLGASAAQRQSDQDGAIADLQNKGAESYGKTLTEIIEKATDIMQQMMSMGSGIVDVLAQILRSLTR
ncbi:SPI-2 type III secretion system translocon protein SseD [Salmonella enterica subsp. salamae]|nr:SPI-2 type III secretion system translocon protein SseD [Salmonella enterica subsp. salamae]ECJ2280082.1 SPI-2 type III secretion system translocon protein SseD [Salmonella enterica subsp. salamae]HCC0886911.1 SPI-2 type III secretion system translocon protein SseD [Salmonella enterica]